MEKRIQKLENMRKVSLAIVIVLGLLISPLSDLGTWAGLPRLLTLSVLTLISIGAIAAAAYISIKLDRKGSLVFMKISAMAITGFFAWAWLVLSFIPRVMRK